MIRLIFLLVAAARGLQPPVARRSLLCGGLMAPFAAQASPICQQGVGPGCDELATSPFIKDLQDRSAKMKPDRDKAALERYNVNNFSDYFASSFPPKRLVRTSLLFPFHCPQATATELSKPSRIPRLMTASMRAKLVGAPLGPDGRTTRDEIHTSSSKIRTYSTINLVVS